MKKYEAPIAECVFTFPAEVLCSSTEERRTDGLIYGMDVIDDIPGFEAE